MNILDYNWVMDQKIQRRKTIPEIEVDVHGHCVHIGPISYACRQCFANLNGGGIQIGSKCQVDCKMCYYDPQRDDWGYEDQVAAKLGDFTQLRHQNIVPYAYSYQSSGETLLYMDDLEKFGKIFKEIETEKNCEVYHHLYTNGILANKDVLKRLKDMEVDEIRFHVSASNFSKKVLDNMYEAAKMNFIMTVEEPAWPSHKKQIIDLLPMFEDVGLKHLDIVETQVTEHNANAISEECAKHGEGIGIYKDHFWQLYDGGMVYDIMEEVVKNNYSYSVLDCNSAVERCRQAKMYHVFDTPDFYAKGFADYAGFDKTKNNKHYEGKLR